MSPPLRWTCKSLRPPSRQSCAHLGTRSATRSWVKLLKQQKVQPSGQSQGRARGDGPSGSGDAQFSHINACVTPCAGRAATGDLGRHQEKRSLWATSRNAGREWRPAWRSRGGSRVHDFLIKEFGRAVPYGGLRPWRPMQDGSVSGIDHDTAALRSAGRSAVGGTAPGARRYPRCALPDDHGLTGGGSNGSRVRLWKRGIAELGQRTRHRDQCASLPRRAPASGNKIEHRLFSFISMNWRAKPLVKLSRRCRPDQRNYHQHWSGPSQCELDTKHIPEGASPFTDQEIAAINMTRGRLPW